MRGDRGGQRSPVRATYCDGVARGDVFEHDLQLGEVAPQRHQLALDENRLAIEDVDVRIGDLAVQQQRQLVPLHRFERVVALATGRVTPASLNWWWRRRGSSFTANTLSLALARAISSGGVLSVRYSVISGWKRDALPAGGQDALDGSRSACAAVVTGGFRFGITIGARELRCAVRHTEASAAPSRRCRCQSSGRVISMRVGVMAGELGLRSDGVMISRRCALVVCPGDCATHEQSFRPPSAGRVTFSCVPKRK